MKIGYKVDDGRVRWAFRWAPDKMARALDSGLDRAAMAMVKAAQTELRRNDSLAFSTLVMAIAYERSGRFERDVKPNTDYAVYLEKGTRPGYWPKRGPIAAWLKARGVGDPKAATARVARHIFKHGTKAHPFWEPAFEEAEPKMRQIIDRYVQRGIEKVFA